MADQKPTYEELVTALKEAGYVLEEARPGYIPGSPEHERTADYIEGTRKMIAALLTRIRQGGESNG